MDQPAAQDTVKSGEIETRQIPRLGLGSNQSRWRLWLTRAVVFSVTFLLLMTVLSGVAGIVEKFFVLLYTG
jgi:hypothetical protein